MLVDAEACAYPKENVHLLLDRDATAGAMRQALAALAERTDEDSIVTIYLSSHGGRIRTAPVQASILRRPTPASTQRPLSFGRYGHLRR